jgi:Flp pilus assembly pilin Flp
MAQEGASPMKNRLMRRLVSDEEGGQAVEYGIILALVAVALLGIFLVFGDKIRAWFDDTGNQIVEKTPSE